MNRSRQASEQLIRKVEKSGFDAIFLTVDAAVPGNRERDQRVKGEFAVRVPTVLIISRIYQQKYRVQQSTATTVLGMGWHNLSLDIKILMSAVSSFPRQIHVVVELETQGRIYLGYRT